MKTIRTELVPYRVELSCSLKNACDGRMVFTGEAITTNETSYRHQCSSCLGWAWLDRSYPYIEHIESPASARR